MDLWLKAGMLKKTEQWKWNTKFSEESESYSPLPANVSSSNTADGKETECNVPKQKSINSAKRRKYFNTYLSVGFTEDDNETYPYPVYISCN